MVEKIMMNSERNKDLLTKQQSQTTNNMVSARLVSVVCTACGECFANRWAYKHCQTTSHNPIFRGDRLLSNPKWLRSEDELSPLLFSALQDYIAIRQRKSYTKYGLTCIYIDSCSDFAYLLYICKIWRTTPLPPGVRGGVKYATLCICSIFCVVNINMTSLHIQSIYLHKYCINIA